MEEKNIEGAVSSETWTWAYGELVSHVKEEPHKMGEWTLDQETDNNISIGCVHPAYIEINEIQDKNDEYKKIERFLNRYLQHYSKRKAIPIEDLSIKFINYGKTELVYVLTEKSGKRVTILVKQPAVQLGKVNQEAQNLLALKKRDENVVAPIDYFQLGDQECYVTPYINQARCIASDDSWGMYIPEPYYRFEPFTAEQERIVNSCMIAKLVSLYDFEKREGISSCKLGGGDFMLPKGWETKKTTVKDTLKQLYLIAAREKIKCSFEDYLSIIREEFSRATINENQNNLIMNLRGRVPMQTEDIEAGIKLGQLIIQGKTSSTNPTIRKDDMER